MDDKKRELMQLALDARANAYAPYSHYFVGAAALMGSGKIYVGANVENASYPCGICAERNAIFHAAAEGECELKMIAIAGGPERGELQYAYPCGVCRQVMREFSPDPSRVTVLVGTSVEDIRSYTLEELLPESFGPENLKG